MDLWKDAEPSQMDKRDSQLEAAILQDEVGLHTCAINKIDVNLP